MDPKVKSNLIKGTVAVIVSAIAGIAYVSGKVVDAVKED